MRTLEEKTQTGASNLGSLRSLWKAVCPAGCKPWQQQLCFSFPAERARNNQLYFITVRLHFASAKIVSCSRKLRKDVPDGRELGRFMIPGSPFSFP